MTCSLVILAVGRAQDQSSRASLPAVIAAATPIYPIGAHTANIQGVVKIKISTDGHRVINAAVEDDGGNPALARSAQENATSWQFANHDPTSFTVTYRYILLTKLPDIKSAALNSKVVLRFPTDVEVSALRWPGTVDVPAEVKQN
jgi:hypothetical protein